METGCLGLSHSHRIGVHEELLNKRVIARANRSGHLKEDVLSEYGILGRVAFQFYGAQGKSRDTVETMAPTKIEIDGKMYTLTPMNNNVYNGSNLEDETNEDNGFSSGRHFPSSGGAKKSKKEKKAKGTRKLSGYMKFAQEARPKILAETPSLKSDIIAVGKKIGAMWRELSDEEKKKY